MNKIKFLNLYLIKSLLKITFILTIVSLFGLGVMGIQYSSSSFLDSLFPENSSVSSGDWTPPNPPLFHLEEDSNDVLINWSAISDAVEYRIYRSSDDVTANYVLLDTISAPAITYTDNSIGTDVDYYYRVTAVDSAGNENDLSTIVGRYAGTKDLVIDDDAGGLGYADFNNNGTVSNTGSWSNIGGSGSALPANTEYNATGGDLYMTAGVQNGQTVTWTTASNMNDAVFEVFANYLCDDDGEIVDYQIYAGTMLIATVNIDQSLMADQSTACADMYSTNTESQWVSLGTHVFNSAETASVTLVAPTDPFDSDPIWADAVAFQESDLMRLGYSTVENSTPADQLGYCGVNTPSLPQTIKWTEEPAAVSYNLTTYQNIAGVWNPISTINLIPGVDLTITGGIVSYSTTLAPAGSPEEYAYYIEALDASSAVINTTTPENDQFVCTYTYDVTVPGSILTVANSPDKEVENRVANSSFEANLKGWETDGAVEIVHHPENGVSLKDQNKILKLGKEQAEDEQFINSISQKIDNSGLGLRSIGFWYNLVSLDDSSQFNQADFQVYLNDELAYQAFRTEANQYAGQTKQTGWQYVSLYLVEEDNQNINLKIVHNQGGQNAKSLLYLDNINTNTIIVNQSAVFTVRPDHQQEAGYLHYRYQVAKKDYSELIQVGPDLTHELQFQLNNQPDNQMIEYWSTGGEGDEEAHHHINVLYDNQPPSAITDLKVYQENQTEFVLQFTAPADNITPAVKEYDIRYSTKPINNQSDWEQLPQAVLNEVIPPRAAGQIEHLNIQLNQAGTAENSYYFAIKSADSTGQLSNLSNVTQAINLLENEVYSDIPIVINEIMYNPIGADSNSLPQGEWLELYNNSAEDYDLNNYYIQDASGQKLLITAKNSDNNLDLDDDGETIIPAHGFFVVYRHGYEFLNNDGDTVSLYDPAGVLVNSYIYQGNVEEGKTEARLADGQAEWSLTSIATPGRSNAQTLDELKPKVVLKQHEPYNAMIQIYDAQKYETAEYELEYLYEMDGNELKENLKGKIKIENQDLAKKTNMYLATCSTGGTCIPHLGIKADSMKLIVTLKGETVKDLVIEEKLAGDWTYPEPPSDETE